jgi:hypothetical protein
VENAWFDKLTMSAHPEPFDSPLILSLSKDGRLAQDKPACPRVNRRAGERLRGLGGHGGQSSPRGWCAAPQQPREAAGPPARLNGHLPEAGQPSARCRRANRAGECVDRQRLEPEAFHRRDFLRSDEQQDVRPR